MGFERVWKTAKRLLGQCGDYIVHKVVLDPAQLGSPCRRERVYIIMLRRDIVSNEHGCDQAACMAMKRTAELMQHVAQEPFENLLYDDKDPMLEASLPCSKTPMLDARLCACVLCCCL